MGDEWHAFLTCLFILLLTFLSDSTELAFENLFFFVRTLRFWLYFLSHFALACFAAILLHLKLLPEKWDHWYVLAPLAVFTGVGLFARTNIEIAGKKIAPIGKASSALKAKMKEQAAATKADKLYLAQLSRRLHDEPLATVEEAFRDGLIGAGVGVDEIHELQRQARSKYPQDESYKSALIELLVKRNRAYAEDFIKKLPRRKS